MNERLQQLKQRAAASSKSTQATLQRTAPKATLGNIKQAAAKKFGQRKPTKKQQPKKTQPKKQPKPKSVSSKPLDQWEMAMRKANIPAHRWRKLQDKISRLSGAERTKIEKELFDHDMFKDVYSVGEDDPSIVDEYLSDLEEKLNEITTEGNLLEDAIDDLMETKPSGVITMAILTGEITKTDLKNALQVMSNETGVESTELIKFSIYNTEDYDFATKGTDAVPFKDFELNKNAIQNAYGIDLSTKEGMDKFEDLTIFTALESANKQKQAEQLAQQKQLEQKQIETKNKQD